MYPSIFIYLKYFFNLKKFSIPCNIQYIHICYIHKISPVLFKEKLISYHNKWKINFKILRKLEKPWKLKSWKKYEDKTLERSKRNWNNSLIVFEN